MFFQAVQQKQCKLLPRRTGTAQQLSKPPLILGTDILKRKTEKVVVKNDMKFIYLFEVVFVDEFPGQLALFEDFSPNHVQNEDDNIETQVRHFAVQNILRQIKC